MSVESRVDDEGYTSVQAVFGRFGDGYEVTLDFTMPALITFVQECVRVMDEPNMRASSFTATLMKVIQGRPR
jgi:hypothetical protein